MRLADAIQEVRELGLAATLFRVSWELKLRSGWAGRPGRRPPRLAELDPAALAWPERLRLGGEGIGPAMAPLVSEGARAELLCQAKSSAAGRILAFGRWPADFGRPIDWHLNPTTGRRWNSEVPWSSAVAEERRVGDVKHTWEIARFPHAYVLARAVPLAGLDAEWAAAALTAQITSFLDNNPRPLGVHWGSGQETVIRMLAWVFASATLLSHAPGTEACRLRIGDALLEGAAHVARHIEYARKAVYNNHLLAEALGLYLVGVLLPEAPEAPRWRAFGRELLEEQADRQFYEDGAYIMQSLNYERGAMLHLLWALVIARSAGEAPAESWLRALGRSCDFLLSQINPRDGSVPNYGPNDGSLPSILSTCDFTDFRPVLQAAHIASRHERLFEPGPWDEASLWLLGPGATGAPMRRWSATSRSFQATGYHVLRGRSEGTFATLRCGSVRDRFGQIDMLHVDVHWRGHNVLVDGGSFQYNAADEWHRHFMSGASHNTLTIDGNDQMLHLRRFKTIYWTQARLLRFRDDGDWSMAAGEHDGFRRHAGGCVHRRSVLHAKDDLWVVVDRIAGVGRHSVRLHWLCGDYPYQLDAEGLTLTTPEGAFGIGVWTDSGAPATLGVAAGALDPIQGWTSRYYGERKPVPAVTTEVDAACPLVVISVFGAGRPGLRRESDGSFEATAGSLRARFRLCDGLVEDVRLDAAE